jgi:hypothetical protein
VFGSSSVTAKMAKDDRSGEFFGVIAFFVALSTVIVALRCYCKIAIVKSFAADDYFSVATWVRFTWTYELPSAHHHC